MEHKDHVNLLRPGIEQTGGTWADLGSGWGAFTLALADLLGPGATIYSVDKDRSSLRDQQPQLSARFPQTTVHYTPADFTRPIDLPPVDGIVMSNALHFVKDKDKPAVLALLRSYLKPTGRLILVEYNSDHGNLWVPHPLSYPTWQALSLRNGFTSTQLLYSYPSRFLREIYSALSLIQ
jgi:ubiquinone/menaquinone biosynthesis C-methylase UbiE